VTPGTTDEGFLALLNGEVDIALALREPNAPERLAARDQAPEDPPLTRRVRVLALDALVPVVSRDNPGHLAGDGGSRAVFSGEIDNWADLGGPDAPVALHLLAPGWAVAGLRRPGPDVDGSAAGSRHHPTPERDRPRPGRGAGRVRGRHHDALHARHQPGPAPDGPLRLLPIRLARRDQVRGLPVHGARLRLPRALPAASVGAAVPRFHRLGDRRTDRAGCGLCEPVADPDAAQPSGGSPEQRHSRRRRGRHAGGAAGHDDTARRGGTAVADLPFRRWRGRTRHAVPRVGHEACRGDRGGVLRRPHPVVRRVFRQRRFGADQRPACAAPGGNGAGGRARRNRQRRRPRHPARRGLRRGPADGLRGHRLGQRGEPRVEVWVE
jgi:hypothetical protein